MTYPSDAVAVAGTDEKVTVASVNSNVPDHIEVKIRFSKSLIILLKRLCQSRFPPPTATIICWPLSPRQGSKTRTRQDVKSSKQRKQTYFRQNREMPISALFSSLSLLFWSPWFSDWCLFRTNWEQWDQAIILLTNSVLQRLRKIRNGAFIFNSGRSSGATCCD